MPTGIMKVRFSANTRGGINEPILGGKRANHLPKKKTR